MQNRAVLDAFHVTVLCCRAVHLLYLGGVSKAGESLDGYEIVDEAGIAKKLCVVDVREGRRLAFLAVFPD